LKIERIVVPLSSILSGNCCSPFVPNGFQQEEYVPFLCRNPDPDTLTESLEITALWESGEVKGYTIKLDVTIAVFFNFGQDGNRGVLLTDSFLPPS